MDLCAVLALEGELARHLDQLLEGRRQLVDAAFLQQRLVVDQRIGSVADRDAVQGAIDLERADQAGREIVEGLDRRILEQRIERLEQLEIARHGAAINEIGDVDRGLGQRGLAQQALMHGIDVAEGDPVQVRPARLTEGLGGVAARPGRGGGLVDAVAERGKRLRLREAATWQSGSGYGRAGESAKAAA